MIKYLKDFYRTTCKKKNIPDNSEKETYYITIPYLESEPRRFINNLTKITKI